MEKSTILARLAMFSLVCCFLLSLSSCTQDDQDEELYVVEAKANKQSKTSKKSDDEKKDDDVDKTKIIIKDKSKTKDKKSKSKK